MNLDELQAALPDQDAFKRALRKEETIGLLKGGFTQGRTSYIHVFTFPNGSQLRLKFYNTVKEILNSKGKPVYGKESFLSYIEVTVAPAGSKAYFFSTDVKQVVWGTSKSKATEKHAINVLELATHAAELSIDLSAPTAWATTYTENY
jgi:hypothetical protein